jgi:hypothetical protein
MKVESYWTVGRLLHDGFRIFFFCLKCITLKGVNLVFVLRQNGFEFFDGFPKATVGKSSRGIFMPPPVEVFLADFLNIKVSF